MTTGADRAQELIKRRIVARRYDSKSQLEAGDFSSALLPPPAAADRPDYRRQDWALSELLAHYDRQFVLNAYLVLLKRDADVEGLTQRLSKLQRGEISRLELLFRLRYGPEGKAQKTRVRGLPRAFLLERLCRVPILGWIPAWLLALLRLPRLQRDIEEIRGLMAMQRNDIDDRQRALVDLQKEELGRLFARLQK